MGNHHWKVEKQPEWYVKAVRKTIAALPGGYAEAADWLQKRVTPASVQLRASWRFVSVEKLTHEQFNGK
ncbi:TPA: hypothetical protein N2190_004516 [Escherichia coli]|nr:hypothetical protein [Escherichia coli]